MPRLPITADWIRRVEKALSDRGMSEAELCRAVGCPHPILSRVLGRGDSFNTSKWVAPISTALGISTGTAVLRSQDEDRLLEIFRSVATDQDREDLINAVQFAAEMIRRRT